MRNVLESKFAWRLFAFTELVLFGLFMFVLLSLALSNLLILAIMVAGLAVALRGSWLTFTGTGGRYRRGMAYVLAGVLAIIVSSIAFLDQPSNFRLLVIGGLLGVGYSGVFAVLRKLYWRQLRNMHGSERIEFKRPYLVVNPKSGNGRAVKAGLAEAAKRKGIKVIVMKRGQDMQKLARQAIEDGADVLGIAGGDGSIGAVAKVAMEHDVPLVVLPGGTRCHFARDLGLDPRHLVDALDGFKGVERRIDVGDINGRIFLNNISLGAYADIVDHKEYREQKVAVTRRVLRQILTGKKPAYSMRFRTPEGHVNEAVQVLVSVNRYTSMKLLELGHREQMDAGILQVTAVLKLTDKLLSRLLGSMSISRVRGKVSVEDFIQFDTAKLRIKSKQPTMIVGVDGEREEYKTPVVVTCRPGALRLCVPAEGVRPRPKSMFSRETLSRLWTLLKDGTL